MRFIDVRRAHFRAKATTARTVKLPPELDDGKHVAELVYTMYGCRDAAFNGENEYAPWLDSIGFVRGANFPCVFFHLLKLLELSVHGDDFSILGEREDLDWFTAKITEQYEVKVRGTIGFEDGDDKAIRGIGAERSLWMMVCRRSIADVSRHVSAALLTRRF